MNVWLLVRFEIVSLPFTGLLPLQPPLAVQLVALVAVQLSELELWLKVKGVIRGGRSYEWEAEGIDTWEVGEVVEGDGVRLV